MSNEGLRKDLDLAINSDIDTILDKDPDEINKEEFVNLCENTIYLRNELGMLTNHNKQIKNNLEEFKTKYFSIREKYIEFQFDIAFNKIKELDGHINAFELAKFINKLQDNYKK